MMKENEEEGKRKRNKEIKNKIEKKEKSLKKNFDGDFIPCAFSRVIFILW